MKMLLFVIAAAIAASFSFYASAGGARGVPLKTPVAQSEPTNVNPRCVRKIPLAASATGGGCLMQKRKSRAA